MTTRLLVLVGTLFLANLVNFSSAAALADSDMEQINVERFDKETKRHLRKFDIFDDARDICKNNDNSDDPSSFGECNQSLFPVCNSNELICFNRRPRKDKFYQDNRQPYFYIDYRNVYCYPDSWAGCSSCSPGRYCLSEMRCILDELNYPCEKWI